MNKPPRITIPNDTIQWPKGQTIMNKPLIVCPFGHCIVSFGIVMRGGLFIIVCPFGYCIVSFGIVMRGG
jgi:hypothetical protein